MTQFADLPKGDQALVLAAVREGATMEQAILDVVEEHLRYCIREALRQEMAAQSPAFGLNGGL